MSNMITLSVEEFVKLLSSKCPTPGGGAAAALAASLGAASAAMAGNYSSIVTTTTTSSNQMGAGVVLVEDGGGEDGGSRNKKARSMNSMEEKALNLQESALLLLHLAQEDGNAYSALQASWAKGVSPEIKAQAAKQALKVPVDVIQTNYRIAKVIHESLSEFKKSIVSDAKVALHLLSGSSKAAFETVLVNKPPQDLKIDLLRLIDEMDGFSQQLIKRHKPLQTMVDLIGNTPLIELTNIVSSNGLTGRILAKLEFYNPGLSKKDRIAKKMIETAIKERKLNIESKQPVVEATSGNTGIGLALVCSSKNIPFIACMSEGNSSERAVMMRALGAEVVLVPQALNSVKGQVSGTDLELVELEAEKIVKERGAFRANQFTNEANVAAHYETTGPEIWNSSPYQIDAFVDFVGTGGSFAGCTRYFKEQSKGKTKCFIVEPKNAQALSSSSLSNGSTSNSSSSSSSSSSGGGGVHKIQGGGYNRSDLFFIQDFKEKGFIDGFIIVSDDEAIKMSQEIAKKEGILGGFSAGANVFAAVQYLKDHPGETVAVMICDSGLKYLSTDLYQNS